MASHTLKGSKDHRNACTPRNACCHRHVCHSSTVSGTASSRKRFRAGTGPPVSRIIPTGKHKIVRSTQALLFQRSLNCRVLAIRYPVKQAGKNAHRLLGAEKQDGQSDRRDAVIRSASYPVGTRRRVMLDHEGGHFRHRVRKKGRWRSLPAPPPQAIRVVTRRARMGAGRGRPRGRGGLRGSSGQSRPCRT